MFNHIYRQPVARLDRRASEYVLCTALLSFILVSPVVSAAEYPADSISVATSSTAQPLSYTQMLLSVQQYHAKLPIWETQQQIARANVRQSRLWTNPSISIQRTGFKSNDDQELEFGISQKLDVFGERRAATRLAQIELQQVDQRQALFDAQLKLIVKAAYAEILVLQQQQKILHKQLDSSQKILDAARLRYQAGSIAQVDFDRSLMSHVENQRAFQESEQLLRVSKQKMAALWGGSSSDFSVLDDTASIWPVQASFATSTLDKPNLYDRAMQLQTEQQRLEIDYLKAKRRPNPTVTLGVIQSKQAGMSGRDNQIRAAVEIPLNLIDRQQYTLQGYAAKQQFLDQQQRFYQQQNANQLKILNTEIKGLKDQYRLMDEQQVPLSAQVLDKMLIGFKVGKLSMTDVQQAALQLQEQQLKKNQVLKQAWQATLQLEARALGIAPESVMSSDALDQINQSLWQETSNLNSSSGAE